MAIDVNISTEFINDTDTPASYVGAGSYKVKVKADESGLEFVADSAGSDTNIMNANLTANADRTQDMNSKSIYFNNGKQFKWLNNVAPTIGQGSFDLQGYGTTASDIIYRIKNGAGIEKHIVYGTGQTIINYSDIRALKITTNDYAIGVDGNGFITYSSPEINGVLTGHRIGRVDGSGIFREITAFVSNKAYNQMRMISVNGQSFNLINLQDHNGNIKFGYNPQSGELELNGLPTSSAGLASGKVWNDSGTLKIV